MYDELAAKLASPEFRPRALFERAGIETLCTTDDAADPLASHRPIRSPAGPATSVQPSDPTVSSTSWPRLARPARRALGAVGREISRTADLVAALEERRAYFRAMGAVAADHGVRIGVQRPRSTRSGRRDPRPCPARQATAEDARRFTGHMLIEMARMSVEDGLVMQLHVGSMPQPQRRCSSGSGRTWARTSRSPTEFTRNLRPLLDRFGNDPRLTLILFTLDETAYARELAPLAGHYPALRLGPPWWFHDSLNGMARYFDQVIETAGLYNTVGFNDDTRAFCSIPVRHDVWRRASANWLAGLVVRGIVDESEARVMAHDLAYGLAKRAYRLDPSVASR